jgi:hypothetical protein
LNANRNSQKSELLQTKLGLTKLRASQKKKWAILAKEYGTPEVNGEVK